MSKIITLRIGGIGLVTKNRYKEGQIIFFAKKNESPKGYKIGQTVFYDPKTFTRIFKVEETK